MNFTSTLEGSDLELEVGHVLTDFIRQNKEFTAYEVTQEVRRIVGPTVEVVHKDVRNAVHKMMAIRNQTYGYETFNRDFGSGVVAQAYRPQNVVKQQVPNPAKGGMLPSVAASIPALFANAFSKAMVSQNIGHLNKLNSDVVMEPKSEGRVTVPSLLMKKAGMYGTRIRKVYLREDGDKLVVSDNITGLAYKLDKHGSFRLRSNHVKDYKRFYMTAKNGSVEIIRAK